MRLAGFFLTEHAMQRLVQMDVHVSVVERVLRSPEVTYCQPNYGPHARLYQGEGIAVAVDMDAQVIKSVMPRTQEVYTRE